MAAIAGEQSSLPPYPSRAIGYLSAIDACGRTLPSAPARVTGSQACRSIAAMAGRASSRAAIVPSPLASLHPSRPCHHVSCTSPHLQGSSPCRLRQRSLLPPERRSTSRLSLWPGRLWTASCCAEHASRCGSAPPYSHGPIAASAGNPIAGDRPAPISSALSVHESKAGTSRINLK
jgi:hypothetical protein